MTGAVWFAYAIVTGALLAARNPDELGGAGAS